MFLIGPMTDGDETNDHIEAIIGAELYVELGNRCIVSSTIDQSIAMIFSEARFNISHVLRHGRILMVVQMYDIRKEEVIRLRFLLVFRNNDTANRFYSYVKVDHSVTDNIISVDIPSHINP